MYQMSFYYLEDVDRGKVERSAIKNPPAQQVSLRSTKLLEFQKVFAAEEGIIGVSTRRI
jgi:hypothetical protein